jgi:hypothetical protein
VLLKFFSAIGIPGAIAVFAVAQVRVMRSLDASGAPPAAADVIMTTARAAKGV